MKAILPRFLVELEQNLKKSSQFIQVILGPRQVGKTTGISYFLEQQDGETLYYSADEVLSPTPIWIEEKWQQALLKDKTCILVLDEIQKVSSWSSVVKKIWDQQRQQKNSKIKLILLGSSSLQIQKGLSESLTGRFQLISAYHWGLEQSRLLYKKMNIEDFITCGGYPGSYALLKSPNQWEKYISSSIVETVINKDILNISRVQKPALFRQTFDILMSYPSQDISYTKLLGQLQDSGNTDLIKSYIELYEGAFLIKSLQKYSRKPYLKKSSSPKIIPLCGALISREILASADGYGRAFEAAVGACLVNNEFKVSYWREGNFEVDFIVQDQKRIYAIEVKSGRKKHSKSLEVFLKSHPQAIPVFITSQNIELFLTSPVNFFGKI